MLEVIASVIIISTLNFLWIHVENNFYLTFKIICIFITLIYRCTITTHMKTTMKVAMVQL